MKSIFTVATIITLVFFFGCSEKKKSEADIDELEVSEECIEPDNEEEDTLIIQDEEADQSITENENETQDLETNDDVIPDNTPDEEPDTEPDEESDEDVVEPIPSVIFVNESAEGSDNGTSWANAFMDLQPALDAAVDGDQIWVAAGKYKPTSVHGIITMEDVADEEEFNKYKHFRMKNGVEIYGGFAGTETELAQRDFETNETILSCDIGEFDEQYDNCFHIFYHPAGLDLDNSAVIDGFLMEGGYADDNEPHDAGSVMYNDGSSPVVKNGWIYWNYSYKGAVFYNKDSSMKVMDTQFVNNEAPYSKGGVFYNENSNIEISGCDFANSWAEGDNDSRGGAIYSVGGKTVVTDTVLKSNLANMGGAIFIESGDLEVSGCTFDENQGEFGGAIYLNDSDSSVIKDTIFQYNVTYDYGDTDGKGGAIRISSSNLKIINSTFFKQISGIGGAVFSSAPDSETSTLTIINSGFSINKMIGWGGAIYLDKTSTEIINSVFFKNYYGYTSQGTIGGAIYRTDSGSLNIVNSIFKSNTAGTGKHIHDAAGNATVTYSCIVDTTVYPGTGNINDEPMLTEPEWAPLDFTLKPDSPCIDTGSNTPFDAGNIAEGITKDMSGNDRIIKGKETSPSAIVDMGAVEFKPAP
ncbi:MAG TPA: hypothetical protein PLI61_07950 [bacterium]|nr:hypothetical protein [bacterium]